MRIAAALLCLFYCVPILAADQILTVAADGSGEYLTVQQAIGAAPDNDAQRTIIHIKPGTYTGPFAIEKKKQKLTLRGDDAATTILTWDQWASSTPIVNGQFNPGVHVSADDFCAENLTIQNTYGDHGQALALRIDGDRALVKHCRIVGWQDTLMINNGRDYFKECYVAGRVDFIYGSATAWFQTCEIHSRNGGHVTAASTPQDHPFGFVFDHCKLTGDAVPWVAPASQPLPERANVKSTPVGDLGRPWRPYASVTFLNCDLDAHIKPEGWNSWPKPGETASPNEKTARYSEYKSTGPGAAPEKRLPWTHQLTDEQASEITLEKVLAGADHWDPAAQNSQTRRTTTTTAPKTP